ncbi:MAG TPA: hypothetical protein VFS11_10250 [Gemmatimonadales bacterium]|nr:hypothetical protein [Gemmatimonadales bacterium]
MSWNYRLVRRRFGADPDEVRVAVHEVYYDDAGTPSACTEEPAHVEAWARDGEPTAVLREELARFRRAVALPVLEYDAFGGHTINRNPDHVA